jgi:hypothetical protein
MVSISVWDQEQWPAFTHNAWFNQIWKLPDSKIVSCRKPKLWVADCELPETNQNCELPIVSCRLWVADCELPQTNQNCELPIVSCRKPKLWAADCELPETKLWVAEKLNRELPERKFGICRKVKVYGSVSIWLSKWTVRRWYTKLDTSPWMTMLWSGGVP